VLIATLGSASAAKLRRLRPDAGQVMMPWDRTATSAIAIPEGTMYIHLVRVQVPPGQGKELARRWQAFWGTEMPQMPGFRHAHFVAGPGTNATVSITVWDQRPEQAAMEPLMEQLRAQAANISAGPFAVEEYETLADF
jgi:heme-degrading monooxygenase HmoA